MASWARARENGTKETQRNAVTTIILVVLSFVGLAFSMPATVTSYIFTTIDDPAADIVNGERTQATGINSAGEIVGTVIGNHGGYGFLDRHGIFTTIEVPGASYTIPWSINAAGQIVGNFSDSTGSHGFLYSDGIYTTLDFPGAFLTEAAGINDLGHIVGSYVTTDPTLRHGFLAIPGAAPVPEPSSVLLSALGIAYLLGWKWPRLQGLGSRVESR